jgi:hypothetical protein
MIERNEEFKEKQGLSSVVAHILPLAFSFDAFATLTSIKEMFNFLVGLRRCNVFNSISSFKKERNYPAAPHLLRHRPAHVRTPMNGINTYQYTSQASFSHIGHC